MRKVLNTIQSIREQTKKTARQEFQEAENARLEQQERVDSIAEDIARIREESENETAGWMADQHVWCMKMEMNYRRESNQLDKFTQEAEQRLDALREARREVRIIELAIETIDKAEALESRRNEARRNDEIGTNSWWQQKTG